MPRARNTQPVQVAPGAPYGQRQQLEQMQAEQPLPAVPSPQVVNERGMAAATAMPVPNPNQTLTAPTQRPTEPVTAGLPIGAGPGPEAMVGGDRRQKQLADQLAMAAEVTGNPAIGRMLASMKRPIGRTIPTRRPT